MNGLEALVVSGIWDGENEEANKLWKLCETPVQKGNTIVGSTKQIDSYYEWCKHIVKNGYTEPTYCMICNNGTEATEQLPNESGYYVCYACKIAQREVIP